MRRTLLALAVGGALLTIPAAALAAWHGAGSGTAAARATSAQALSTVDASASTSAQLYPGGSGDVKLSIHNPNAYPVRVTSVTGSGTITSDKGAACDASTGVTFANQTGLSLDVAAGATTTFTLSGAASMSNASDNACQGAVFTIPVSLTGASNA